MAEVAALVEGRLVGDESLVICGVKSLDEAGENDITFAVEAFFAAAEQCSAAAVILPEGGKALSKPAIYVRDPRAAFARLLEVFTPPLEFPPEVSELAYIGPDVKLGQGVTIMPFAVVDAHAVIGDRVCLYPHTYVGQYAAIGDDAVLYANVTVREYCRLGQRVIVHSGAVIGSDGFGFTTSREHIHTKVPQVGHVVVEDDVEIGAQVGIDRATTGATVIGRGTKIDNLVHIGHNCRIGANNLIVAQTGISGSTIVGDNVTFGGQVGTVGHIHIGGNSVYAARSGITNDMPEGVCCAGFPPQPHQEWLRMQAAVKKLPEYIKRIKALEKKLAAHERLVK